MVTLIELAIRGGHVWWVSPSYRMSTVVWRDLKNVLTNVQIDKNEVDRYIALPTSGTITVRSADNPDSLRGAGLDYVILDECPLILEQAWTEALRPTLADRNGGAMLIGTPKGRNWFWRMFNSPDMRAWRFPTSANPYIPPDEIEAQRASLPERVYLQEIEAQFIDDAGGVFRRVAESATAKEQREAVEGHEYIVGVDWGKHEDYTAITVIDLTTKTMAMLDRFNRIDYVLQRGRLAGIAARFRPRIIIAERNAMGDPIIEQLQRDGMRIQPFTTTNATKAQIIDGLALAFERGELTILNDRTLITELQAYQSERLPSGMLRYGSPSGMHDDTVMALALAWSGAQESHPLIAFEGEW